MERQSIRVFLCELIESLHPHNKDKQTMMLVSLIGVTLNRKTHFHDIFFIYEDFNF